MENLTDIEKMVLSRFFKLLGENKLSITEERKANGSVYVMMGKDVSDRYQYNPVVGLWSTIPTDQIITGHGATSQLSHHRYFIDYKTLRGIPAWKQLEDAVMLSELK